MTVKRKVEDIGDDADRALECDVHEALKAMGWLMPESEAEVQPAEAEVPERAAPLPAALLDPDKVFTGRSGAAAPLQALPLDTVADEHLARAARAGGPIPPEIEERMRRDRQAAEDELDQSDDGQAIR